jgi:hypothetical protein
LCTPWGRGGPEVLRGEQSVVLNLVHGSYAVSSDDARWISLLSLLWEPLVTDGRPNHRSDARVAVDGKGWRLRFSNGRALVCPDPWLVAHELQNAIVQLAVRKARDAVPLHAAAVLHNGIGLLLVGPSGAGKSTLALELVARGWSYAGDDLVFLSPEDGPIRAFPKPLHVKGETARTACASRWRPPGWLPAPTTTALIPPGVLRSVSGAFEPTHVVFPRFRRGDASLRTVSSALAVGRAAQSLRGASPHGHALTAIARALGTARSGELTYESSEEGIELLMSCLEDAGDTRPADLAASA